MNLTCVHDKTESLQEWSFGSWRWTSSSMVETASEICWDVA